MNTTGSPSQREGMHITAGSGMLVLLLGDITLQDADAIVNAANSGGGPDNITTVVVRLIP